MGGRQQWGWRRLSPDQASYLDLSALVDRDQRGRSFRIETLSNQPLNDAQGFGGLVRALIRAIGGERVERVRYRNHARQQRNLVALQSVRIASAIQRLVM